MAREVDFSSCMSLFNTQSISPVRVKMVYGVSNSYKRGVTRTYSRRTLSRKDATDPRVIHRMSSKGGLETETIGLELEEIEEVSLPSPVSSEPLKNTEDTIVLQRANTPEPKSKRAVDSIPSSPLSPASNPFSDDDEEDGSSISLPSSPPRRRYSSVENHTSRKSTFNSMTKKRKRDNAEGPLSELSNNAVQKRHIPQAKKQKLIQTKIDLGGQTHKTCKDCGMEYVPSDAEDTALHKSFHSQNIGGVDLGRGFVEAFTQAFDAGTPIILTIDGKAPFNVRRKVRKVLEVVRTDLGAIEIEDDYLWGTKDERDKKSKSQKLAPDASDPEISTNDKPKVFLYCVNDRCIGLCLVERIKTAAKVVCPSTSPSPSKTITQEIPVESSSIFTSPSSAPMLLGISRIWVSKSRRGHGIATELLDSARTKYFYGIDIPKTMVAFSQPTASGMKLAEAWFGGAGNSKKSQKRERGGWHVYAEGA